MKANEDSEVGNNLKKEEIHRLAVLENVKLMENEIDKVDNLVRDCALSVEANKAIFSKLFILFNNSMNI
jgi:hypothetical protein